MRHRSCAQWPCFWRCIQLTSNRTGWKGRKVLCQSTVGLVRRNVPLIALNSAFKPPILKYRWKCITCIGCTANSGNGFLGGCKSKYNVTGLFFDVCYPRFDLGHIKSLVRMANHEPSTCYQSSFLVSVTCEQ